MNVFTVWILVTATGGSGAMTSYSPPMLTQEQCVQFQKEVDRVYSGGMVRSRCIQTKIVK